MNVPAGDMFSAQTPLTVLKSGLDSVSTVRKKSTTHKSFGTVTASSVVVGLSVLVAVLVPEVDWVVGRVVVAVALTVVVAVVVAADVLGVVVSSVVVAVVVVVVVTTMSSVVVGLSVLVETEVVPEVD